MADKISTFLIPGMDCPMEEKLIREKLAKVSGVLELKFNLMDRLLKVRHAQDALDSIATALDSLDLGARLQEKPDARAEIHERIAWKRIIIAGILALGSEICEFADKWSGGFFNISPDVFLVGGWSFGQLLSLLLAVAAIAIAGLDTYKKGWISIKNLSLNINALMSVAVSGALLIGQFPEAAAVIVLFNLSEAIESRAMDKTRNAIKDLVSLTPETASVCNSSGGWDVTDINHIPLGSMVRVGPGERIGLDGIVVSGESTVNQAPVTGESIPVEKKAGSSVFAGSLNENGSLEYRVTAIAANSTLARIIHAVEEAQSTRAPIQRFVDVFAKYYTPSIFAFAILVGICGPIFFHMPWLDAIYEGLVILVIGCPCALVLSTPVSIVSGMVAAARSGILVKGGVFMEQGRLVSVMAMDKTGTLTIGRPEQTDYIPLLPEPRTWALIGASLAACSDHPVSLAIAAHAKAENCQLLPAQNFKAIPGQGISGEIAGQTWHMGNRELVKSLDAGSTKALERMAALEKEGKTVVALYGPNGIAALFGVADQIRPGSFEAVRMLKKLGVSTIMLTGDNRHAAQTIAAKAGIEEFRAEMLPEDKLNFIASLEKNGEKVGMAGDGINDAPALAKADISFSMAKDGTDTAIETADVAIMDDDLRKIPRFLSLSRSTFAILVENICLALLIKAVFFVLALTGHATMWMAVFADVGAALIVIGNGLRAMSK